MAATVGGMLTTTAQGHDLSQLWGLLALLFLAGILLLNWRFYWLFVDIGKPFWVPLVIPLHVLFYLYGGLAFAVGMVLHLAQVARRRLEPRPGGE